ncbi:MAG: putative cytosol aminopeptidase, partial [Frankiales bacterium]|nr:putative cytosol aminopeptidase [Frankiales bacterium]
MTTLSLSSASAASAKVDAIVIGVARGPKGLVLAPGSDSVATALGKGLLPALAGLGATGRAEEVTRLATLGATTAAVVVAVGLGDAPVKGGTYDAELLRRATGAAVRALAGTGKVAVTLAATGGDVAAAVRA